MSSLLMSPLKMSPIEMSQATSLMSASTNPSLCLKNLRLSREKNGSVFTLDVPELNIFQGQTHAIIGQSGCGKSTLLDILALILRPDSADLFQLNLDDKKIDLFSAKPAKLANIRSKDIGYVLQSGGLFPFLSVEDNILLPARLVAYEEKALQEWLVYLCDRLAISDHIKKKPQHLSGGQRQRVAIARALALNPSLILADEPTAAVDQATAIEIFEIFQSIVKEINTALLVVSHDVPLVSRFADHIITFGIERLDAQNIHSTVYKK